MKIVTFYMLGEKQFLQRKLSHSISSSDKTFPKIAKFIRKWFFVSIHLIKVLKQIGQPNFNRKFPNVKLKNIYLNVILIITFFQAVPSFQKSYFIWCLFYLH